MFNKLKEKIGGSNLLQEQFDSHFEKIKQVWNENISPELSSQLQNDEAMSKAAIVVYELLPSPFRFVVSKEKFVVFALDNRDRLVQITYE